MTFKFTLKTLTESQFLMSYGRSFQLVAAVFVTTWRWNSLHVTNREEMVRRWPQIAT